MESRSQVVSSFTIIKGALIDETYAAFSHWDLSVSKAENLRVMQEQNTIGARSQNWLRDVGWAISRRFDPDSRDRPLVQLARNNCDPEIWKPLLLWHMTRDEFLVRDFLLNWLYPQYADGSYRLRVEDVLPYLRSLSGRSGVVKADDWSQQTTDRVASGLLRIAADFGLLTGTVVREFTSYHLPDESLLYLVYALSETEDNARRVIESPEWRMYLMDAGDVERELLRLHQFRRLGYEAAGSLARLDLPSNSLSAYAEGMLA